MQVIATVALLPDRLRYSAGHHRRRKSTCILGRKNRKQPIEYDQGLYKQRNLIERMFGKLKDWRRIAMRYDRCANTFMAAICIAATIIFWF